MNQNLHVTPLKVKVTSLGDSSIVAGNEDVMMICTFAHYAPHLHVMRTCAPSCYAHLHAL